MITVNVGQCLGLSNAQRVAREPVKCTDLTEFVLSESLATVELDNGLFRKLLPQFSLTVVD